MPREVPRGRAAPLGATLTPGGVNFAVYSQHAGEVSLALFDRPDAPVDWSEWNGRFPDTMRARVTLNDGPPLL